MTFIAWGPKLEIGFSIIDSQHKRLVDLINELHDAIEEGKGKDSVGATLKGLVDYTHTHFRTEEALLEKHGYDELIEHKREHRIFTDQIEIYRDRFESNLMDVSIEVLNYLRGWLLTHITSTDREYIPTFQAAGVE